jgi:hypothetical protein
LRPNGSEEFLRPPARSPTARQRIEGAQAFPCPRAVAPRRAMMRDPRREARTALADGRLRRARCAFHAPAATATAPRRSESSAWTEAGAAATRRPGRVLRTGPLGASELMMRASRAEPSPGREPVASIGANGTVFGSVFGKDLAGESYAALPLRLHVAHAKATTAGTLQIRRTAGFRRQKSSLHRNQ